MGIVENILEETTAKRARDYADAVSMMLVAKATGDKPGVVEARGELQSTIAATLGVGEIIGASTVLRDAARYMPDEARDQGRTLGFSYRERLLNFASDQTILPAVTFEEALADMVSRTPVVLRPAAERTAQKVSELYGSRRVVAFAKSAEQAVTERVQSIIEEGFRTGLAERGAGRMIVEAVDKLRVETRPWSEAYARMSFRTNVNTAATAGRFRQVQDPAVRAVIPAFEFDAVGDSNTRDNHRAGKGIVLLVDNPVWGSKAPPLGYSCRCRVLNRSRPSLRREGRIDGEGNVRESRIPSTWHADPGFRTGGRPDLFLNAMVGAA